MSHVIGFPLRALSAAVLLAMAGCASLTPLTTAKSDRQALTAPSDTQAIPADAERHYQVAKYWLGQQRATEALGSLNRALQANPSHVEALNARASLRASLADTAGARTDLDRALSLAPERSHLHYNSGILNRMLGQHDAARAAMQEALRLQPDHAEAAAALVALGSSKPVAAIDQGHVALVRVPESALEPSQNHSLERLRELTPQASSTTVQVVSVSEQPPASSFQASEAAPTSALTAPVVHAASVAEPLAHSEQKQVAPVATVVVPALKPIASAESASRLHQDVVSVMDLEFVEPVPVAGLSLNRIKLTASAFEPAASTASTASTASVRAVGARLEVLSAPVNTPAVIAIAPAAIDSARIDIANGNGITGMARALRGQLRAVGVPVATISNWSHFHQPVTRVLYREGFEQAARELAQRLPVQVELVAAGRLPRADRDVMVVLGRDMRSYRATASGWETLANLSDHPAS